MPAPASAAPASAAPASAAPEDDAPTSSVVSENPGAPVEDGAPVGPSEGEETAFLAEQREQGYAAPAPARGAAGESPEDDKETGTPLPPLDDLVGRIPAATRQQMDELFRARFITVKRVPKSALK